jgi:hypothetical protein
MKAAEKENKKVKDDSHKAAKAAIRAAKAARVEEMKAAEKENEKAKAARVEEFTAEVKAKSANILEMKAAEKENKNKNKKVKDDSHKAAKAAIRAAKTASEVEAAIDKEAADVVAFEVEAADKADKVRQQNEAERQRKIDERKIKAQAALEAKEVTPSRILKELYDEIGIGPFSIKGKDSPNALYDPFGALYKFSMYGENDLLSEKDAVEAMVKETADRLIRYLRSNRVPPQTV